MVEIRPYSAYNGKYSGLQGKIQRISGSSIGVAFFGIENPNSNYGVFWFKETDLKEIINNESEDIELLNGYKSVGIKFLEGSNINKEYIYACYDEVNSGDFVVVKSAHHGWGIAQVSQVYDDNILVNDNREVIAKFDPSLYFERIEKAKRLLELKENMDMKVKQLQHLAIYEALAKDNPEMKELLDEFKSLI